ncbi:hypothetical protein Cni_G01738 [Canna indica]|uniref:Uncharacterized protein n=1 Tax=Canna indica TaxID=4628 RepID=A0AAQ3PYQ0_9LILI|nr:hypothetical protein Cni_G01738 [Canna indica]
MAKTKRFRSRTVEITSQDEATNQSEETIESSQPEDANESPAKKKKTRDYTCMAEVWNLPPGDLIVVRLGKKK